MLFTKKYLCSKCRRKVASKDIRYTHDGAQLVCHGCYTPPVAEKKATPIPETHVKLICTHCRYHFSYRLGSNVKLRCPYCGQNSIMKDNTTAYRLLEDADRITA